MRAATLLLLLPLAACFGSDKHPVAAIPVLPDLPADTAIPCPPAEQLTGQLGDLASKDARLAVEYAKCRARADTAVGAYQDAQRRMRAAASANKRSSATRPR